MADPKYENLPGIAYDQPDCYETDDLPEADQPADTDDYENESIEKLDIKPNEAFDKFKRTKVDADKTDFSDKISRTWRTGYIARSEYEMVGEEDGKETPSQKYNRLQHEIRELAEEVNLLQKQAKDDASTEKVSAVELARQTEFLQHQLADLHLDNVLGPDAHIDLADPEGALQKRLLSQIDAFKAANFGAQKDKPSAPTGDDQITYELYFKPEQAKFSNTARSPNSMKLEMAEIEQRLERLEAVIGQNPEALASITAGNTDKSLVGAVAKFKSKLSLFDPEQLDQVESRLVGLGVKLNQIKEKKDVVENEEKKNKVAALYDIVKKWESCADLLPHVVERLVALRELHEQALQFSQALTHLDTSQQQMDASLQAHGDMLKTVNKSLVENVGVIEKNCNSLDQRLKALNK